MIYALIGGKSKDSKLNIIEKYIFRLTKKEKPNIRCIYNYNAYGWNYNDK